ncbi:MAG: glutamate--tRNA ligase [bacterium]
MLKKTTRTRFAPSPTGYLHIGSLRNALYDYIFAKQNNGKYVLRIEDTDQSREVAGASEELIKTLNKIGLPHNEGPILENGKIIDKGDFGPYLQSKRIELYQKYAKQLVDEKKAYYCFCTSERLNKMREDQQAQKIAPKYDRHCLDLTDNEIQKKIESDEKYVVRFKIPDIGEIICNDLVKGEVKFKANELDDFVLLKSDNFPTYHLANIVDDYFMKITHVLRGDEWLPSLPKHLLLWQAFGWESPEYAHLPLLLNADKSKLSKRQGDVFVEDYLDKGYLPETILNFVALLGWNPGEGSEQEIFSMDELIEKFDINKVNKSGAVFNIEKLDWMNGMYIRKMDIDELTKKCLPYFKKWFSENEIKFDKNNYTASESPRGDSDGAPEENTKVLDTQGGVQHLPCSAGVSRQGTPAPADLDYIKKIVSIEQTRLKKLSDITDNIKFFYFDDLKYDPKKIVWKKSNPQDTKKNLQLCLGLLNNIGVQEFTRENLEIKFKELIEKEKIGVGDILWPLRYALTAEEKSPNPFEVAWVLGKSRSIERVERAINLCK